MLVTKVDGIVTVLSEISDGPERDADISQTFHDGLDGEGMEFFIREGGGVLEGLADILRVEQRVVREDLLCRHAVGHQIDDKGYRDSHAANTGTPPPSYAGQT